MTRKPLFLTIFAMVLLTFLIFGCGSTPTPDPSIVWSDDFEDGDTDGWEEPFSDGEYSVHEGVLITTDNGDILMHESRVSSGTWSFDVFFPEEDVSYFPEFEICLSCDQDSKVGFGMFILGMDNSIVSVVTLNNSMLSRGDQFPIGRKLTGWNHFDITRDESGNSKIYLNGELILEYKDELTISPQWLIFDTPIIGPVFDNVVVRDQVIDSQPAE